MAEIKYDHRFDIQVALKVIRHISSGIYRDIGGSLKELVSNSFDAQATEVVIQTGHPKYDTMTVVDNGVGMTPEIIEKAFHNVGLSLKVTHPDWFKSALGRPTIGRFGIGFLAAAHISHDILVRTFPHQAKEGTEIHLDLRPYFDYMNKIETFDEFKFGTVSYRSIENPNCQRGTSIHLRHIAGSNFHRVITTSGDSYVPWPESDKREGTPGASVAQFVEDFGGSKTLYVSKLTGREQILWQLGITCPVEYLEDGPIRGKFLPDEMKGLISDLRGINRGYRFRVWYDGVEVRKPILLPTPKVRLTELDQVDAQVDEDVQVWPLNIKKKAETGAEVRARGYLVHQPHRVAPAEIRGLYPRIGGVGIGANYEQSALLRQLRGEAPLFRVMVSGELYIEAGLSEALNLDRSGFMEIDSEYRTLAGAVVTAVSDDENSFVKQAKKVSEERHRRRERLRATTEVDARERTLARGLEIAKVDYSIKKEGPVALRVMARARGSAATLYPAQGKPRILVDHSKREVLVDTDITDPQILAIIALVDRLLGATKNPEAARREFAEAISSILSEV